MTTEKDIIEEMKQIEIDCLKSVETNHPEFTNEFAEGREELYNFKLSENWHHYLEKKAELKGIQSQKQKIIEEIEKRIKDLDILINNLTLIKKSKTMDMMKHHLTCEIKVWGDRKQELLNSLGEKDER